MALAKKVLTGVALALFALAWAYLVVAIGPTESHSKHQGLMRDPTPRALG
jgi:hypothetical protein